MTDRNASTPARGVRRLWIKLLAGFGLVAVVAVGLVAVLANHVTTRQFEIYVSQGRQQRAERLAPDFAAYYARTGSWDGVSAWMADLIQAGSDGRGPGRGRGQGQAALTDRLVLVDPAGQVLADSQAALEGERLSEAELTLGVPIDAAGETVGILLAPAAGSIHESLEGEFLQEVNRSLIWAGLGAGGLALALGWLVARQLTAPLQALTWAARRMAGGDLHQRVPVRGQDELGELGQAFNQMAEGLEQQEMLRRNLMADIAHELRTPLSIIRGDLEAVLDGVYEPTPETLASLQEETLLLSRLVDDLRALAQAEAGQLRLESQPTDLAELLHGIVEGFDLQAESHGQTLSLDLPREMPLLDADPQRIRQVVANLVSNALRHAPAGGHVTLSASVHPAEVQISVADDGPGIAPQDLPHVFDRFWRGSAPGAAAHPRAGNGSGLGLAIARELIRAHQGRIWVDSESGQGSVFTVALPLHRSSEP